jgi:hypothetical protein
MPGPIPAPRSEPTHPERIPPLRDPLHSANTAIPTSGTATAESTFRYHPLDPHKRVHFEVLIYSDSSESRIVSGPCTRILSPARIMFPTENMIFINVYR